MSDPTNPDHYRWHPLGIECIDVTEHFPSNIAHAIEYLWRCGRKDDAAQDLRKAIWYIEREIKRLGVDATARAERNPKWFTLGDRVVKDPDNWEPSEFDAWGSGIGVGVVVGTPDGCTIDVRWPGGRSYHDAKELKLASTANE